MTDNMTAMFYINRQGSTLLSPFQEALQLWDFCISHFKQLEVSYFQGPRTWWWIVSADPSTTTNGPSVHTLHSIFQRWEAPQVDLFVTRLNRKCQQFCSFLNHSPGSVVDTFLLPWGHHLMYAFPPFALVHKVLLKMRRKKTSVIFIGPAWPQQHWYTKLQELSVVPPMALPLVPDLIRATVTCSTPTSSPFISGHGSFMAKPQGVCLLGRGQGSPFR